MEGCLSHRDSDPTWSKARDDAYAQKERPGGEPYRPSPFGDFVTPLGDYNLSPPGRRTGLAPCKINAPPLGDYNLDLKILLLLSFTEKERPRRVGVQAVTLRRLRDAFRRPQTIPCRVGIQILISKRPRPAARRLPTWSKISSAAHSSANRSPAPARRDPSPLQNIIIIPSLTSPIKPTIYAIIAQ